MDDRNFSEVAGAPGVPTSGTHDDLSAQLIASLVRLARELYGQADAVGERFCHEVTKLSRGCARLLLRDHQAERMALATLPAVCQKLSVAYCGIAYGELFIACDPKRPTYPALSLETSAMLAETCGWLLHVLEEGALLNCLGQRIDLTLAERLSRTQLNVPRHMAMGEDMEAIASALHITVATVETHRCAIYARLGVHGPLEAVLAGHRLGLSLLIGSPAPSAIPSRR